MLIQNSILAGEVLLILERVSGSVRIVEIEAVLQTTKHDTYSVIRRLVSEGLIELIEEDERNAIILNKNAEMYKKNYLENKMPEFSVSVN